MTVTAENVTSFALDLPSLGLVGTPTVRVNDQSAIVEDPSAEAVITLRDGRWELSSHESERTGRKKPGVCGPLDDVRRRPQLIVYGTQDSTQTEANRIVAEHMAGVNYRADIHYPVKRDVEVVDEDLTRYSLVLIGNPDSNLVTARVIGELPVRFEPGALVFGQRRYEGEDVGISMIHPSPFNPDQYVVLHAGVTFLGTLAARYLPELVPDYLVYDSGMKRQFGMVLLDERTALDGGFFTQDWSVSNE